MSVDQDPNRTADGRTAPEAPPAGKGPNPSAAGWAEDLAGWIDGSSSRRRKAVRRRRLLGDVPGPVSLLRTVTVGAVVAMALYLQAGTSTQSRVDDMARMIFEQFDTAWRITTSSGDGTVPSDDDSAGAEP